MAKITKVFLTLVLAIAMVTACMTLVANAETINSDSILQKFLVVYNMNETTRVTNSETGLDVKRTYTLSSRSSGEGMRS